MKRLSAIVTLALLIALPLILRARPADVAQDMRRLVIITPHGEPIRAEFARAFTAWARQHRGVDVVVDWRTPGGSAEIIRYLDGQFRVRFHERFPHQAAGLDGFTDARAPEPSAAHTARNAFLASDVGVGIDLFFGGGEFPHRRLAERGYLVDAGLLTAHPDWFTPEVMPQTLSGETIYDPLGRYYGACLAVFGIAFSPDRLRDLGIAAPPGQWVDLSQPIYYRQLTLADPTKSGAAATIFERIIQQQMALAPATDDGQPDLHAGWQAGFTLIKRLVGNSRWITDSASKPTRDTVRGDSAASMAIDFQARLEEEHALRESGGIARLGFAVPVGGTSVSADPIALLRGAPERDLAIDFIRFVLSPEGQRLWNYRVGTPGGPQRWSLRRLPVRRDVMDGHWQRYASDPTIDPFALAQEFTYHPQWTQRHFTLIGSLIKAVALDARDELQAAWQAIIAAGGPDRVPEAWAAFSHLPVQYEQAGDASAALGRPHTAVPLLRRWTTDAQAHYRRARLLAEAGR